MLNKTTLKLPLAAAFLVCELVLGILVQVTGGTALVAVSYACVALACLFVSLFYEKSHTYYLTQAALVFTLLADLFLVVMSPIQQLPAMVFFSFTQLCYFLRLYMGHKNRTVQMAHCVARIAVVVLALALTVIVLGENTDALSLVSLFYYANLIVNIIFAFIEFKKEGLLAFGLLLFLLCDTVIGLNVMASGYLPVAEGSFIYSILHCNINLAWIFYVPSQALIAISLLKFKKSTV